MYITVQRTEQRCQYQNRRGGVAQETAKTKQRAVGSKILPYSNVPLKPFMQLGNFV